jgi:predicted nucleic acid-binding protein
MTFVDTSYWMALRNRRDPRHDEREYSFVDATSFAVMRALRLRNALAFDGDFTAAGFVELREAEGAGR